MTTNSPEFARMAEAIREVADEVERGNVIAFAYGICVAEPPENLTLQLSLTAIAHPQS
jgi:hypothetical protein